jgi:hypothetical protein
LAQKVRAIAGKGTGVENIQSMYGYHKWNLQTPPQQGRGTTAGQSGVGVNQFDGPLAVHSRDKWQQASVEEPAGTRQAKVSRKLGISHPSRGGCGARFPAGTVERACGDNAGRNALLG